MIFCIDPPGPYSSVEELRRFLASLDGLDSNELAVQTARWEVEYNLKAALARQAREGSP